MGLGIQMVSVDLGIGLCVYWVTFSLIHWIGNLNGLSGVNAIHWIGNPNGLSQL